MSTIYIIQPDDDARKDAINALMDSLDKLYPDEIITHQAIAIKTEIPAVIQLLTSLVSPVQATLTEAGAPPSPDEKPKARRQPRSKAARSIPEMAANSPRAKKNGSGESSPAIASNIVEDLIGDPPDMAGEKNASAAQVARWKILDSGKELSDLYYVLKNRQLAPGARVRNKTRGLYEVIEKPDGRGLTLRRLAS